MTITLKQNARFSGSEFVAGRVVDARDDLEAELVQRGAADYVSPRQLGRELFGPGRDYATGITVTPGTNASVVSSGFVTFQGERMFRVVASASGATQNHVEINLPAETVPHTADSCTVEFATPTWSSISTLLMYLGTAGYSVFASASRGLAAMTDTTQYHGGLNAFTFPNATWVKTGFSGELTDQVWTAAKLRVVIVNGQTATFLLRSIRVNDRAPRGRICVSFDDGRDDFTWRAMPILQRHGIKASLGIIPTFIGATNYMNEFDLRRVVEAGHECVAHGPRTGGNLWDAASDEARLDDMFSTVSWLDQRRLLRNNGDKVYIWPQGRYGSGVGDVAFIKKAYAAGFRFGRTASRQQPRYHALRAMSSRCETRLTYPILGHLYAGAANVADDAAETTNISGITGEITAVGADRLCGVLMFHEVVARGAASTNVQIEADRLNTIMAHLRSEIDAGRIENVLMSELVD